MKIKIKTYNTSVHVKNGSLDFTELSMKALCKDTDILRSFAVDQASHVLKI